MAENEKTPEEWGKEFLLCRPVYETYLRKLADLVSDLLSSSDIDVIQVDSRVKAVESFAEKIKRKSSKYKNPLKEITDLAGLRIIAYYREDIRRITDILRREFEVIDIHSSDKST